MGSVTVRSAVHAKSPVPRTTHRIDRRMLYLVPFLTESERDVQQPDHNKATVRHPHPLARPVEARFGAVPVAGLPSRRVAPGVPGAAPARSGAVVDGTMSGLPQSSRCQVRASGGSRRPGGGGPGSVKE